jgi:hypothetical protein
MIWLGTWEGLVLKEVGMEGERLYRRIGHSQRFERKPEWRNDFRMAFGQEKRVIRLV